MKAVLPYKPEHPVMRCPTKEQARRIIDTHGLEEFNRRMLQRNEAIEREEKDPLNYGYEPPIWKLADLCWGWITWAQFVADPKIPQEWKTKEVQELAKLESTLLVLMGGNRAAKTTYMLKRAVQCLVKYARAWMWCFHQNSNMSIAQHQALVWHFLPQQWKDAGKGQIAYVSYTTKNGFSDGRLVGPNGSVLEFRNYEQDIKSLEGPELGDVQRRVCLGYVADELAPVEFIETLKYRLATRAATGMLGFTAIEGETATVRMVKDGSRIVLDRMAEHLHPQEKVPVLRQGANKSHRMLYFHSDWNPYGNFDNLLKITEKEPRSVRKVRLYGETDRARETAFGRFSERIHVKRRDQFPKDLTWWMICDPGGAQRKNMAKCWIGVDVFDRYWVYREWPCPKEYIPGVGFPEPWAKPGQGAGHKYDGVPDNGCKSFGWTLVEYKEEIARLEGWPDAKSDKRVEDWVEDGAEMPIAVRYIDSRFADTPSYTASGNTTLLEEFANIGLIFEPTSGASGSGRIADGVELIQDRIGYKEDWDNPHDGPKLFVAEECVNMIFALKVWTGLDGTKGATKDWIDLLRYAVMARICYISKHAPGTAAHRVNNKSRLLKP